MSELLVGQKGGTKGCEEKGKRGNERREIRTRVFDGVARTADA